MITKKFKDGFNRFHTRAPASRAAVPSVSALVLAAALSGCGVGAEGAESASPSELTTARDTAQLERTAASCTPLCSGSCSPVQIADVYGLDQPILPVGEHVYFSGAYNYEASYSFFGRASKSGGSSGLIAQNLQRPPQFLSNGTSAYAIFRSPGNSGYGYLNELRNDGSITPVPGIDGSLFLSTTAIDSTRLYTIDGNRVWATPLAGGAGWTQVTQPLTKGTPRSLRVDSSGVYIVADDVSANESTVWKATTRSLSRPVKLVTVPGSIVSLTLDDTHLYFADRTGGLFRALKSGGAVTQLATTATNLSVAVDAERYYWFNGTALTATCKSGGNFQVLATVSGSQTSTPGILSVNDEAIYWRNYSQIWKVAK